MNRTSQRYVLCLLAGSLLLTGSGCVISPAGEHNYYRGSRINLTEASRDEIQQRVWTRADVALKFGAPEEVHENGKIWIYRWTQLTVIAFPDPGGPVLPPRNRALWPCSSTTRALWKKLNSAPPACYSARPRISFMDLGKRNN